MLERRAILSLPRLAPQFGQYVLKVVGSELVGGVRGNEADWRKATFKRAFTPQEELVSGSAWMLHFENGVP